MSRDFNIEFSLSDKLINDVFSRVSIGALFELFQDVFSVSKQYSSISGYFVSLIILS